MLSKKNIHKIAVPFKVFMILIVLLFTLAIAQVMGFEIICEIASFFDIDINRHIYMPEQTPIIQLTQDQQNELKITKAKKKVLPNGNVHQVAHIDWRKLSWRKRRELEYNIEIYDPNRQFIWKGPVKDKPFEYLEWSHVTLSSPFQYRNHEDGLISERRMREIMMITPEFSHSLIIPTESDNDFWRYDPQQELFINYSSDWKETAYIGATGLVETKADSEPLGKLINWTSWIPKNTSKHMMLWQTTNRLYQINFTDRKFEMLLQNQAEIEYLDLNRWRSIKERHCTYPTNQRPFIHILTADLKHHLVLREPKQKITINVPQEWSPQFVQFAAKGKKVFMQYKNAPEGEGPQPTCFQEIYQVDASGNMSLINRYLWKVPEFEWSNRRKGWFRQIDRYKYPRPEPKQSIIIRTMNSLSPPVYDPLLKITGENFWRQGNEIYREFGGLMDWTRPKGSLLSWFSIIICAAIALWHAWPRRTSRARLIFWVIFVGIFNLAGLLTYWALNHTPVIACPVCGAKRGLERTDCVRCWVQLPRPEKGKFDLIFDAG
ncbi:MAG: hypothetical protein ACYSWP_15850 [Planctomycetota bacterium]|jgi:hypothetical protein